MGAPVISISQNINRLEITIAAIYLESPDAAQIKLFTNDVEPDENQTRATFEEANYDGYAPVNLEMSPVSLNDQGMAVTKSNLCNFSSAAGVDTQTIYGIFIVNADDSVLLDAQRFAVPQVMGGEFPQAISGVWRESYPPSTYGWVDVEA